jgi:hypothetical protein
MHHHHPESHHTPIDLKKPGEKAAINSYDEGDVDLEPERPAKILLSDGLPAWIGGSAAMAIAGAPMIPALAVGLISGIAISFFSARGRAVI